MGNTPMKAFDFDNTIYRGESSLDFSLYMIRTHKKILLYLPVIMANAIRYKLCLVDKEKLGAEINKYMKLIIRDKREIRRLVKTFWQTHADRLDTDMLRRIGPDDLIITAGPDFLLDGIRDQLGTQNIISSVVDLDRIEILHFNFKDNKVSRFRELYGNTRIDAFYTNSYNDRALMEISDKVFLVKKGKIKRIQ